MVTFGENVISFCKELNFTGSLPNGILIMNPFRDNPEIIQVISDFYNKFYNDIIPRHLILGINPGRFGAGVTGIPFTDTKRLREKCGIDLPGVKTHETSSVFIYEMIDAFGGPENFYSKYFINSVCPLGFTYAGINGRDVNYNYYDSKVLTEAVLDFIISSIKKQIDFGVKTDVCFCLGAGKNYRFLNELNLKFKFFRTVVPLDHPRYIMQYMSKQKQFYINDYLKKLR